LGLCSPTYDATLPRPDYESMLIAFLFFFSSRRRHTRSKRDWSSDVCSSDLTSSNNAVVPEGRALATFAYSPLRNCQALLRSAAEIGRASCRERVWISVVGV